MIKAYFSIVKPGIIFGNAITVAAGFALASKGNIDWGLFVMTLLGISLVMASGCVFNNYIDRDIDSVMERTKDRVLVKGLITPRVAIVYATVLGILGLLALFLYTNTLTTFIALGGLFVYVIVYTLWLKRRSLLASLPGSIAGAVPPVVGYLAVRGEVDLGAGLLFLILMLWQIPHALAISSYRVEDYVAAGIPVLPAKRGMHTTKMYTILFVALFAMATFSLAVFGYVGQWYLGVMALVGIAWLVLAAKGLWSLGDKQWARTMFVSSIVAIVVFSVMIAIGN
ncbi:MAG: heme o synthase [Candidatus Pacebacteria bacterium]|nr:heme o synthase [Candidatus Paceibacterota bacterium]